MIVYYFKGMNECVHAFVLHCIIVYYYLLYTYHFD